MHFYLFFAKISYKILFEQLRKAIALREVLHDSTLAKSKIAITEGKSYLQELLFVEKT